MDFSGKLQTDKKYFQNKLNSDDIIFFDFTSFGKACVAIYVDSITDKMQLGDLVLRPLAKAKKELSVDEVLTDILSPNVEKILEPDKLIDAILSGKTALLFDGEKTAISVDLLKFESRAISEPPSATVIKGPREGFTESIKTNLSLLRRKIKSEGLVVNQMTVGKRSQTSVAICYLSQIADDSIVKEVKKRIEKIDIDAIPDSSYIGKMILEHRTSLFKQVGTTEKPDILMAKMLEGRIGIIVDGSPIVLTVPYVILEDFQTPEDYYQNIYRSNMQRAVRFLSIFLAIGLPAIFVAAELYHLQIIPLNFLLTIVNSIKGIPLSPSYEMFFTLLIFEILNEASIRMPKYVGMALSIVGALVLGDTAVRAGIVSSPAIMIMALSAICLYTVPELVESMSFLRLLYLFVAGSAGGYGMVLISCFFFIYLSSLENFGAPYLAPFSPLITSDLKDSAYLAILPARKKRPKVFKPKDKVRINDN